MVYFGWLGNGNGIVKGLFIRMNLCLFVRTMDKHSPPEYVRLCTCVIIQNRINKSNTLIKHE